MTGISVIKGFGHPNSMRDLPVKRIIRFDSSHDLGEQISGIVSSLRFPQIVCVGEFHSPYTLDDNHPVYLFKQLLSCFFPFSFDTKKTLVYEGVPYGVLLNRSVIEGLGKLPLPQPLRDYFPEIVSQRMVLLRNIESIEKIAKHLNSAFIGAFSPLSLMEFLKICYEGNFTLPGVFPCTPLGNEPRLENRSEQENSTPELIARNFLKVIRERVINGDPVLTYSGLAHTITDPPTIEDLEKMELEDIHVQSFTSLLLDEFRDQVVVFDLLSPGQIKSNLYERSFYRCFPQYNFVNFLAAEKYGSIVEWGRNQYSIIFPSGEGNCLLNPEPFRVGGRYTSFSVTPEDRLSSPLGDAFIDLCKRSMPEGDSIPPPGMFFPPVSEISLHKGTDQWHSFNLLIELIDGTAIAISSSGFDKISLYAFCDKGQKKLSWADCLSEEVRIILEGGGHGFFDIGKTRLYYDSKKPGYRYYKIGELGDLERFAWEKMLVEGEKEIYSLFLERMDVGRDDSGPEDKAKRDLFFGRWYDKIWDLTEQIVSLSGSQVKAFHVNIPSFGLLPETLEGLGWEIKEIVLGDNNREGFLATKENCAPLIFEPTGTIVSPYDIYYRVEPPDSGIIILNSRRKKPLALQEAIKLALTLRI